MSEPERTDAHDSAATAGRPDGRPAVALRDVHKHVVLGLRRKRVDILNGVSLTVDAGETFGLLGPNGAGKTTTIKVALGLMRPSSGEVALDVEGLAQVGYLPENPYFYDYLTGREFLDLCGRLFALDRATRRERAETLLADVGLESSGGVQLRKYSKGMLQRIGIAQALINDPSLVLLDEPMTGLDPIGRVEVKDLIARLGERGKTVLFNSHILADVGELCSHIGIMREGVVIWRGSVDEALSGRRDGLEGFFMEVVRS